jgi:CopG antitoxin of type II toxin-antitoxin system
MNIELTIIPRDVEDKLWMRHHSMARNNRKRDPIPGNFATVQEAAEFWDTHDLTDYEDIWQEVDFHVNLNRPPSPRIELEPEIANEFAKRARAKKMTLESYVNRTLREYLDERAAR